MPNLSAARRGMGAVTSPLSKRELPMRVLCAPDVPAERRAPASRASTPRRTIRGICSAIPNLKPSQNSKISTQICKWSRPLLIDSALPTEFVVTPRKQTTEKILTGARTHIRPARRGGNFAKQHLSARRSPTFLSQNGPPKTPIASRRSPSFLSRLPRVHLGRTKGSESPSRFLPGLAKI